MRTLLFLIGEDSAFCSHRLNLGKAALKAGFKVAIATRCHHHAEQISNAGIDVFPLQHFTRGGLNPWQQFLSLKELYKIYKHVKPDIVHHVALKPVIFGTLIARLTRVPKIINALGGLGYLFIPDQKKSNFKKNALRLLVCQFLKRLFSKPNVTLILQNQDDINSLKKFNCITPSTKISLIRGAGVNMVDFPVTPMPPAPPVIIACVSRMLWDKGIGELVKAAKRLREKNISFQILLWGTPDPQNPATITEPELKAWHDSGIIVWKGFCSDVAKAYQECHIAVLPSYREGLPKSLLEAASCARPIITTDVPGCREVVQHNVNGLLVPVRNEKALADALELLIQDEALRLKMGLEGRKRVELYFEESIIHEQTLALYN